MTSRAAQFIVFDRRREIAGTFESSIAAWQWVHAQGRGAERGPFAVMDHNGFFLEPVLNELGATVATLRGRAASAAGVWICAGLEGFRSGVASMRAARAAARLVAEHRKQSIPVSI